jgi:hypothetical protein
MDAQVLVAQLGVALPLLGAHSLLAGPNSLQFGIRGCKRGNKIRITLAPSDTYSVELWRVKGAEVAQVGETVEGVYVDSLHDVLENLTGLYTRFNRPG